MTTIAELVAIQDQLVFADAQKWSVGIEASLGAFGCCFTAIVIYATLRQPKTAQSIIILAMCASDFVMCFTVMLFGSYNLSKGRYAVGIVGCYLNAFVVVSGCFLSLLSLFLFTLDRYMTIIYEKALSVKKSRILVLLIAFASLVMPTVAISMPKHEYLICLQPSMQICSIAWYSFNPEFLWLYVPSLGVLVLCIMCILVAYTHIIYHLRILKSQLNAMATTQSHAFLYDDQQLIKKEKKVFQKAVALTVLFIICWTPYVVGVVVQMITREPLSEIFDAFGTTCASLNSVLNPVLLYLFDPKTREHVKELLTLKKSSHGVNLVMASWDVLKK
ncbi:hypothetical protein EDD86DRAFT_151010 [Gorgonomyces haynaldii]|nr:hypothetical protein EDD86DRAFT_151010 [Gorgonomyces haynaldii]